MARIKADYKIGLRMAEEMERAAAQHGRSAAQESEMLNLAGQNVWAWRHGVAVPDARSLRAAAEAGMDVVYILTGKRGRGE